MAQKIEIAAASTYEDIAGAVKKVLPMMGPTSIELDNGRFRIIANLTTKNIGRFDSRCFVAQDHNLTINHNVDEADGTLRIQRFVRAGEMSGVKGRMTSGAYLGWTAETKIRNTNNERTMTSLCRGLASMAAFQDDGPREAIGANDKLRLIGSFGFVVNDQPSLLMTFKNNFPYCKFMQFIFRIEVATTSGKFVGEFSYDCLMLFESDPYDFGLRHVRREFFEVVSVSQHPRPFAELETLFEQYENVARQFV